VNRYDDVNLQRQYLAVTSHLSYVQRLYSRIQWTLFPKTPTVLYVIRYSFRFTFTKTKQRRPTPEWTGYAHGRRREMCWSQVRIYRIAICAFIDDRMRFRKHSQQPARTPRNGRRSLEEFNFSCGVQESAVSFAGRSGLSSASRRLWCIFGMKNTSGKLRRGFFYFPKVW